MIQVLVQVPAGSCDRFVYDEKTLEYRETRRNSTSRPYPYPYGFIIGTRGGDGDCVDCYLITKEKLAPGTVVECEPIGLLLQDEGGEMDHKVLAVMPGQAFVPGQELLSEMQEFIFAVFTRAPFEVHVGPILSREAALDYLQASRAV